jgi:AcrR family transcriptional regulator
MTAVKATRRRGAALEDAILDAAWKELAEKGYAGFTLEAVAQQAGTSRPVLSRRWASRIQLAAAAMVRYADLQVAPVIPDLGNVRDEMIFLLRGMSNRAHPQVLHIFVDMRNDLVADPENLDYLKSQLYKKDPVGAVLKRAIARKEVDPERLTPRITTLPIDLARHDLLMSLAPLTEDAIREIVDDVFLPLVRTSEASSTKAKIPTKKTSRPRR